MIMKLVGHAHKEGTSKTSGKPYSMDIIYVTYADAYVTGFKTAELVLQPEVTAGVQLIPGRDYDFDIGLNGRVVGLTLREPDTKGGVFGKGGAR